MATGMQITSEFHCALATLSTVCSPPDWVQWHEQYERADSSLSSRLKYVQQRIKDALDVAPPGPITLLSMCAGDGRDVLDVVAVHPRKSDVQGRLVEVDPALAARARQRIQSHKISSVTVLEADAGNSSAYRGTPPAHLALVCGVFGNIVHDDIHRTITELPRLLAPHGTVVWTRHRREPDVTPQVREWFLAAGFRELGFDGEEGRAFGVGTNQLQGPNEIFQPNRPLFRFVGDGSGALF